MRQFLVFVETSRAQTLPALLLGVDRQLLFFNCPQGTQRILGEQAPKLSSGHQYLLTRLQDQSIGGLPGLLLTNTMKSQFQQICIYGPEGIVQFFDKGKYLLGSKIFQYAVGTLPEGPKLLGLKSQAGMKKIMLNVQQFFYRQNQCIRKMLPLKEILETQESILQFQKMRVVPLAVPGRLSYLVVVEPLPGAVNKDKIAQFGLSNQMVGQLLRVKQIDLKGRIIRAEQIKQKDGLRTGVLVLDVADESSLERVRVQLDQAIRKLEVGKLSVIVHLGQLQHAESEFFSKFLDLFPETINMFYQVPNKLQHKHIQVSSQLSKAFPGHFPDLSDRQALCKNSLQRLLKRSKSTFNHAYSTFNLRKLIWTQNKLPQINILKHKVEEFSKLKFERKQPWKYPVDPKIVFLGTASMLPLSYRNVSSILFDAGAFSVLLDCGQGTFQQFAMQFGDQELASQLQKVKVLFVSHLHGDHSFGTTGFVKERKKYLEKRNIEYQQMIIIVPKNLSYWLAINDTVCDQHLCQRVLMVQTLRPDLSALEGLDAGLMSKDKDLYITDESLQKLIDKYKEVQVEQTERLDRVLGKQWKLMPVPVDHCPQSYGILLSHQSGFKLAYSGDTLPCHSFAEAVKGSTILIHQCTFDCTKPDQARLKGHSTLAQACEIGKLAGAWRMMMTHFSTRYAKQSVGVGMSKQTAEFVQERVGFAYDNMSVRASETQFMPSLSALVVQIFGKDQADQVYNDQ